MKGYPTLDLHGVSHEDGDTIIEDFILEWIECLPAAIVTGYSEHYQKRVQVFAKKWGLSTHSQWWWNNGCLVITEGEA